jgi:hypothetical protein
MKLKPIYLFLITLLTITACKKDAGTGTDDCERKVVINKTQFEEIESDEIVVSDFTIVGNCLNITVRGSGCDGNSWVVNIIDSEEVVNTKPAQRKLRVTLRNNELCQAYFARDYSFNLTDLQVEGDSVLLKFEESGEEILYEY